ncbi:MAG: ATP-dependent DNA helicase DinG [Gammaproteobacteria bacterium]|nr:ATP-dependent DNA helicase DinG [Gammaproteobacteria bacterium]MYE30881.1 ATP-dependent DNA helicase DinG [Gammaproteobacteria bacterium]
MRPDSDAVLYFSQLSQPGRRTAVDSLKKQIQSDYRRILDARGFRPRQGQRRMIAEIFNTLAEQGEEGKGPVCVVEAGTGTGKTLAYLLAGLPLAMERGLKLVVATVTVALQEQLVNKDIPQVLEDSELQFHYALAKGRGRYLCRLNLENLLRGDDSRAALRDLFDEDAPADYGKDPQLWEEMRRELEAGRWKGDRDDWKEPLAQDRWQPLTVRRGECLGSRCRLFGKCCFYDARRDLDQADCIVANQDLVLTDLALGGGAVLPAPEECIYVFDEAHHLPEKSNRHFAHSIRVRAEADWLERCETIVRRMSEQQVLEPGAVKELNTLLPELRSRLQMAWLLLQDIRQPDGDSYRDRVTQTFELGKAPPELCDLADPLAKLFGQLEDRLDRVRADLRERSGDEGEESGGDGDAYVETGAAESWFPIAGNLYDRAMANRALWDSYAAGNEAGAAPRARWLSFDKDDGEADISISSSPVLAAENLRESLWQRCAGAVLTSATLSALGEFSMLNMRAGLPEHAAYLSIPSPFPFAEAASLEVPRMGCEPRETQRHTDCIIRSLPPLLDPKAGSLMLFSSRVQMHDVLAALPEEWRKRVLCQDDHQKFELLRRHCARIDKGKGSVIFGLASFAEGIDLPGNYCTHVLIAKIPFPVPSDPVERTLADWFDKEQGNSFMKLSLPQAAFRLKQACGRLLRNETDSGRITLFDERIARKFYGKGLLESLPPFRREMLQDDISLPERADAQDLVR